MTREWAAVSAERVTAADAQLLWLSARVPNDQLLVYVFDGKPAIPRALAQARENAEHCPDLRLRIRDDSPWRYPRWVRTDVSDEQFVVHQESGEWADCLNVLAELEQLDVSRMAWRLHVFPPNVVVMQIAHALADGTRTAALAATVFGRRERIPAVVPDGGNLLWRGVIAARAHRRLVDDIKAGVIAPPKPLRPALSVNARSTLRPVLRTIVIDRQRLANRTVTVAALSLIAEALGGYLADRGEDVGRLGAEVPVSGRLVGRARNNFRSVNVDLHPGLSRDERCARITHDLQAARRRIAHPAELASSAAFAAVPAPLLRWGLRHFDPEAESDTVAGHTVVSSVNRGPADLTFGGRPVVHTAGFPALSPMMGLTHGIHGIGHRIAVSVHADPGVVDVDEYLDRLNLAQTSVWPEKCE